MEFPYRFYSHTSRSECRQNATNEFKQDFETILNCCTRNVPVGMMWWATLGWCNMTSADLPSFMGVPVSKQCGFFRSNLPQIQLRVSVVLFSLHFWRVSNLSTTFCSLQLRIVEQNRNKVTEQRRRWPRYCSAAFHRWFFTYHPFKSSSASIVHVSLTPGSLQPFNKGKSVKFSSPNCQHVSPGLRSLQQTADFRFGKFRPSPRRRRRIDVEGRQVRPRKHPHSSRLLRDSFSYHMIGNSYRYVMVGRNRKSMPHKNFAWKLS